MDLGEWLKGLGLGQYEATFREHEIDADVLRDLTEADLEKIGLPLGARKRLMKGIAGLASKDPRPSAGGPAATRETSPGSRLPQMDLAERRPITVMFCDLVGSTALASRLDPEDWRSLVNAYLDEASGAVNRLGGYVLKRLGDGLMALFGYPQAQENDAERAVRAALAIQRALAELNARKTGKAPELVARIGLDCGPVVIDATGEVFGEAPNVAARVQALAEPGAVLVTAAVQRQTAGLFVAKDQGPHALKGVPAPVPLYCVVRASGGPRFGARALTPLVGREEELDILRRRWERARRGEGQLALVVGEPGIGKSRLVEEFRLSLGETPHTFVEWSSSQLLQNTPLHPITEWGRQRFGVHLPADQRFADLETTLRLIGLDATENAPLLAPLVDIPLPPDRTSTLAPEELRRRQLAALVGWVLAGARSQPSALAFEDLQWADPSSLDLMRALTERGRQAPLLIIATARPEFRPPWTLRSHHSLISLAPLDHAQVRRMVGELASLHALAKEIMDGVSERTGGVPLFIEEVTRLLLERGEQGGTQAIPPTLQQSLAARLDRLGPARDVAQIGAVLGRDFAYLLLRDVANLDDAALQASLERLAEADILFVEGIPPQSNYRFKHVLIQDAACESLLKSRRQTLHRRAAEVLRDEPQRTAAEPEVIAHHFTEAGLGDLAIEWWGRAGDQALRRSAFQEAISHLGKAIEMAELSPVQPSGPAEIRDRRRKLRADYALAVAWATGYTSDRTAMALAEARDLAVQTGAASERFASYYGRWTNHISRDQMRLAREVADAFLADADSEGDDEARSVAESMLGVIHYFSGHFALARDVLGLATRRHHVRAQAERRFQFGLDINISATVYLGMVLWILGDFERSKKTLEDADRRAVELGHKPTLANARHFANILHAYRGDSAALLPLAERQVALCREHGMAFYRVLSEIYFGWAYANAADPEVGLARIRTAIEESRAIGLSTAMPFLRSLLAHAEMAAKHEEKAVAEIDAAIVMAQAGEAHCDDAPTHMIRGEILLRCSPPDPSEAANAFSAAFAIAEKQGARAFRLLAALPLAKLHSSSARFAEARSVLGSALEGFTPTSDMPEIAAGLALLSAIEERAKIEPFRST